MHSASAFKFSHSSVISTSASGVYQHYNAAGSQTANYGLRHSNNELGLATSVAASTSTEGDIKYDGPYNSTITSTYALRPNAVDSTTVSSTDGDLKFESLYASNTISTSQTVSQRRGSLQLWQFLVALLDEPTTR